MEKLFWPIVLMLIALGILVLELFIPSGGLLGILAGTALLAAVIAAFVYGGTTAGWIFLIAAAVVVPIMIYAMIKVWPHTPFGRRVFLQPPHAEDVLPDQIRRLQRWVGRDGMAVSPMLPSGAVEIEGVIVDAVSEGMPIDKGTPVRVVAAKANHLIVRPRELSDERPSAASGAGPMIADPFEDA